MIIEFDWTNSESRISPSSKISNASSSKHLIPYHSTPNKNLFPPSLTHHAAPNISETTIESSSPNTLHLPSLQPSHPDNLRSPSPTKSRLHPSPHPLPPGPLGHRLPPLPARPSDRLHLRPLHHLKTRFLHRLPHRARQGVARRVRVPFHTRHRRGRITRGRVRDRSRC